MLGSGALDGFTVELISGDDITLTPTEAVPTAIRAKQQVSLGGHGSVVIVVLADTVDSEGSVY